MEDPSADLYKKAIPIIYTRGINMIREPAANGNEAGQRELEAAYKLTLLYYLYISDEIRSIFIL